MAKKKPTKPANFPLYFWDGLRAVAERRAEEDHGGNLTTYINKLIQEDGRKNQPKKK